MRGVIHAILGVRRPPITSARRPLFINKSHVRAREVARCISHLLHCETHPVAPRLDPITLPVRKCRWDPTAAR